MPHHIWQGIYSNVTGYRFRYSNLATSTSTTTITTFIGSLYRLPIFAKRCAHISQLLPSRSNIPCSLVLNLANSAAVGVPEMGVVEPPFIG